MERSEILELMATLQLSGMRAAYDEIITTAIKRKHSAEQILGAASRSARRKPLVFTSSAVPESTSPRSAGSE